MHFNVLGTDRWVESSAWPVPQLDTQTFYLNSGPAHSNSLGLNDGRLTALPPTAPSAADQVAWSGVSTPCSVRTKVQTAGLLELVGADVASACGPTSEQLTERGALTYTTDPFDSTKVLAGPIGMKVYASSTTRDAEFIAGVERVKPDGTVEGFTSGALIASQRALDDSLSWKDSHGNIIQPFHPFTTTSAKPLVPGQVVPLELSIRPIAMQLEPGDRLRITLSTSDIPFALPTTATLPDLIGGVYSVQRSTTYPSSVTIPLGDPSDLGNCRICTVVS
jgi:putative CocE/NonD family hydrolase